MRPCWSGKEQPFVGVGDIDGTDGSDMGAVVAGDDVSDAGEDTLDTVT